MKYGDFAQRASAIECIDFAQHAMEHIDFAPHERKCIDFAQHTNKCMLLHSMQGNV